jgi:ribonuclease D
MTPPRLVATGPALLALRESLARAPVVCFDAEGPGQGAFPDRLCLLVVAAHGDVHVVDPLAVDPAPLASELARTDRPLIVHDVAFDARLFALSGLSLGLVHDTAVAATMLGFAKTGLASLARDLLGVIVDKSLQASAWSKRPLDDRAMRYLANDARIPLDLHGALWPRLEAADLVDETIAETEHRVRKARESVEEARVPAWWKLPFARALGPRERAWLRAAWLARDAAARSRDRAPALLLTDDELHLVVRSIPRDAAEIRARLGRRANDGALTGALVEALSRSGDVVPDIEIARLEAPAPSAAERERAKVRRKRIVGWRGEEAKARGVGDTAVLPGHLADRIASDPSCLHGDPAALSGMGRRRWERYADTLRTLLEVR